MIERKCSKEISFELDRAAANGDLDKVKELVENQGAIITNISYMFAVQYKHTEILQYFLEKDCNESLFALDTAVTEGNKEIIENIISFWKNNKEKFKFDLDSAIVDSIRGIVDDSKKLVPCITIPNFNANALDMIRFIIKTYDE